MFDNNYIDNNSKKWSDQIYLKNKIIWLAKLSLGKHDYEKVLAALKLILSEKNMERIEKSYFIFQVQHIQNSFL